METDLFELPDQETNGDYQYYTYGSSHDDENISGVNSGIPFRGEEMEYTSARKQPGGDTKLFRNIVKRYGPGDQREYASERQLTKERSPNKQLRSSSTKWKQHPDTLQPKFSFHPEIGEMPKDLYKESGAKVEISKEEQWERILRPKTETLHERERQKIEKEAQDLQENCTFQPTISKNYQLSSAKYVTNKTSSISDRLYGEGIEKLKTKEMEKRRGDADAECTFTPDVMKSVSYLKGDKVTQKPLHERLGDIMKQKQEYLQRLRMEAELNNKDMAFKPAVNEHSQILADAKKQVQDVTERLMKDATEKVYKKMKQTEEYESQLTSLCTFKPNVNPISQSNDAMLSGNDLYVMQKDVVTRQYLLADIQRENLQRKAAEIIAQEGCTFAPKVNKISQFLIEADPSRINENDQEKFERLSKKDAQKREIFQEQIQKAHYDQFTYRPEINQISKDIGKKTTIDDLAYNRDAKEHIRLLRERSIDNMLSECSFRPKLNHKKKYENVEPLYRNEEQIMDNVKLHNKKKEIKYDQLKKVEEYNQMKECTFKPKIKGDIDETALKPKLVQSVAGLDKFMQMRDRHKKQQLEKKQREEEIFHIEKKYSAAKHEGFTTPQPFSLSKGSKNSIRDAKVAQELREKMTKEYTFKPSTNEGKNREIINKLISNPEGMKIK